MEAAAKTVELLTQRHLPVKPHHLSYSEDWRFRQPTTDDPRRFEEWHSPRLQYMTLFTDADRGVLLTRSYYDMREDPPKAAPREVTALSSKANSDKKKLSLSDYKNKKTTTTASQSPPEPYISKIKEGDRLTVPSTTNKSRHVSESRAPPSSSSGVSRQHRDTESLSDHRRQSPNNVVDMSLPPKPPSKYSLPPRPPSPAGKRRYNDHEDELRPPQKRSKPELTRYSDDRRSQQQQPHDDTQRRRDREPGRRETYSHPESTTLVNGRSSSKGGSSSTTARSPASRPRGDSVNGSRSSLPSSSRVTPTKQGGGHAAASKPAVPPLLSPLRLTFEDEQQQQHQQSKAERRRRDDSRERSPRPTTTKNKAPPPPSSAEITAAATTKKPLRKLPPLLSPTLPPKVEAALRRKRADSEEDSEDRRDDRRRSPPLKTKKSSTEHSDDDAPLRERKRMLVTLRIPKLLRQSVKRLLALPPTKDRSDDERASSSNQARKRPTADDDGLVGSIAMKKSSSSRSLAAPTTPPRKGTTAMSRVNSNTSIVHTPGDTIYATPTGANSSGDRRANGGLVSQDGSKAAKAIRDKEARMSQVGRRLKHVADVELAKARSPGSAASPSSSRNVKLGYVVAVESILSFMLSFQAQNLYRNMNNKKQDPAGWVSIFPLLDFFQNHLARRGSSSSGSGTAEPAPRASFGPLYALFLLLRVLSVEEVLKCYVGAAPDASSVPSSGGPTLNDILRYERLRARLWPQVREANSKVDSDRFRVDVRPWTTLDEIAENVIKILRRWCADEEIDWLPELGARDYGRHS